MKKRYMVVKHEYKSSARYFYGAYDTKDEAKAARDQEEQGQLGMDANGSLVAVPSHEFAFYVKDMAREYEQE